jgi:hypothetical protein
VSDDVKQRCPHDGGACHHKCARQCYRASPREWARRDRVAEEDCETVAHVGPHWSGRPSTATPATSTVTLTLTCTLEDAAKVKLFEKLRKLGFQVKE